MKRQIITCLMVFGTLYLTAQGTFQPKQIDSDIKGIIYNQEFALNMRLHTNGFSLGMDFGKIKTYYQTKFFHVEIGEIKHVKETRQNPDYASFPNGKVSRAFKYGKQNNLYTLRIGYGTKRYYSEKAKRKGVAVGISYEGGATLGLLKPYYLELFSRTDENLPETTRYSEEIEEDFLDIWKIYGSSGWTKGLDEISIRPGIHGKIGVHFDWGAFDEYVKALEVGVMLDIFHKKVPIMVERENVENRAYYLNVFINLQFGKRW